jgi:hypothetical protein
MGEKLDVAKDLFDAVDQECKDSFEAFLLTIEAAHACAPSAATSARTCG